ncbi:MAG: phage tail protein [Desulfovibrio sp.]|jgi:hypothetical protein|nr:phage tail protein [Desulfovibrio sp.]
MRVGSLGDIVFETSTQLALTPDAISKSREARYEDHQVQGELPRSEFLAPELAGFEMSIRLNASMGVDPVTLADGLSRCCKEGRVLRFIIAGYNFGRVTIRNVSQEWRHIMPGGKGVQVIALRLTLKEYV